MTFIFAKSIFKYVPSISLYQKLALTLTAFVLCLMFLMFYLTQKTIVNTELKAEQTIHIDLAFQLVNQRAELREKVFQYDKINKVFETQKLVSPTFDFYLLDVAGNITAHSIDKNLIKIKKLDVKSFSRILKYKKKSLPILSDDPTSINQKSIFSVAPIYYAHTDQLNQTPDLKGYLYIVIGGAQHQKAQAFFQRNHFFNRDLIIVIGVVIMLLVFLLILFSYFTKPLRSLTQQANKIWIDNNNDDDNNDDNNFEQIELFEWNKKDNNEIHQLGHSVNEMIKRLQNQFKQLQRNDENRKVLLADLSHDLRTPLASMSGYLEILKTQDNIAPSKQDEFLDVVIRNSHLLKGYIDQIFELAYIEAGEVTINHDSFSLSELMSDIVVKYQLKIKEKNITVSLGQNITEVSIESDIEKLERIISNLVDNAIRHTPKNGKIAFNITQLNQRLEISITDTGVGIHTDDLDQIFKPRFKAQNSMGDSNKNIGLGLSISKRLVELLNGDIIVKSQLGKGSTFIICLKLADNIKRNVLD